MKYSTFYVDIMLTLLGSVLLLFGKFGGAECSFICPSNCMLPVENVTEACNYTNGECLHGCQTGYAGPNCSVECPHSCALSKTSGVEICNATSDECFFGCKDGSYGTRCENLCFDFDRNCKRCSSKDDSSSVVCDECNTNLYRDNGKCLACNYWCAINLGSSLQPCRENDGHCNFGCKTGRYGYRCGARCSATCKDVYHRDTGTCLEGCKFQSFCGPTCAITCNDGCASQQCNQSCTCSQGCYPPKWGEQCENLCNTNCNKPPDPSNNTCERSNGSCLYGCNKNNYWGSKCTQSCSANCVGQVCEQSSGNCTGGCDSNEVYGERCDKPCDSNCVNGTCKRADGYCDSGCIAGNFGDRCHLKCNNNCVNDTCERPDGYCDVACTLGWYGTQCDKKCSNTCKESICERREGNCSRGCTLGWYGDQCNLRCSSRCLNLACKRENGNCTHGYIDKMTNCGKDGIVNMRSPLVGGFVSGWLLVVLLCAVLMGLVLRRYRICKFCKGRTIATDEQQEHESSAIHEYMTLQHEHGLANPATNYDVLNPEQEAQITDSSYEDIERDQLK